MRTITIDGITKPILDEISIRYNVESIEVTENNEIYVTDFLVVLKRMDVLMA